MMPWWVLAILIFGANFAIWGFISLCRHIAALIRKVRAARAITDSAAASVAGPAEPDALALAVAGSGTPPGSAMSLCHSTNCRNHAMRLSSSFGPRRPSLYFQCAAIPSSAILCISSVRI